MEKQSRDDKEIELWNTGCSSSLNVCLENWKHLRENDNSQLLAGAREQIERLEEENMNLKSSE